MAGEDAASLAIVRELGRDGSSARLPAPKPVEDGRERPYGRAMVIAVTRE
jgi:hypothetical protein